MDEDLFSPPSSLPSSSGGELSAGEPEDSTPQGECGPPASHEEPKSPEGLWTESGGPAGDGLLSTEEQVTLITESLTVTPSDQEKLLLLNKNTELRRVNKELMKLNEDWDQVYRSATLNLQRRLEAVELENNAIRLLNGRLLLKVKHQQSAKDYYEQALMQELKKNHELQEYVRLLESRTRQPERERAPARQDVQGSVARSSPACPSGPDAGGPGPAHGNMSGPVPSSPLASASSCPEAAWRGKGQRCSAPPGDSQQEVQALKDQLEALRCQTEIYEAEYQTEHSDHKHTQQENRRLRKKREEMRQQVALLQEQLKIYEDDFRRERSDKQMLQRLLLQKTPANKDPVLIHRCNNEQQLLEGDRRTQGAEKKRQHRPLCPDSQREKE